MLFVCLGLRLGGVHDAIAMVRRSFIGPDGPLMMLWRVPAGTKIANPGLMRCSMPSSPAI